MSIFNPELGTHILGCVCDWEFQEVHLEASLKGHPASSPSTSSEPLTWSQITLSYVETASAASV